MLVTLFTQQELVDFRRAYNQKGLFIQHSVLLQF